MALAFFRPKVDTRLAAKQAEAKLGFVTFTVHKFNNRPKPRKTNRIKIIGCFSEFGCETIGCLYCIPRLLRRFPGQYVIAMGWYGRQYLYKHLVDEYWELDEEYMWLREYTRAFHHISKNLEMIEKEATTYGEVVPSAALGRYAVANSCRTCGKYWYEWKQQANECPACKSTYLVKSVFSNIGEYKPQARKIPKPSAEKLAWAKELVGENAVGIFARGRKTYGRNMEPSFYVDLIKLLEDRGHKVIWLGEKQSTQPCSVDHVLDFSRMDDARDLEKTLAIICNLKFTVQFWTASTRLSGMMGVPFLLFESPEQVYASHSGLMAAQEGKRLELTTFGNKKVVISHFKSAYEDPAGTLNLVTQALNEMEQDNWEDVLGFVEDVTFSLQLQDEHYKMLT